MCGIAGFWKVHGLNDSDTRTLQPMLTMLHHRGPDGHDAFVDTVQGIALGHTRLSIVDLEHGDQPLYSKDRNHVLTTNGEFYNFGSLRTNLTCQGARFQTRSDSEIALHLYQRQGLDFVHSLRGEFAFALFDREENQLILVRDRFGIKPLYFHFKEDAIFYASEIKAILQHPDVPKQLCPKAILHQLMHTMVPGTSAFKDIYAVKPGHMIIIKRQRQHLDLKEYCYWDVNFPLEKDRNNSIPDEIHIEEIREKLIESVRLRLVADVPVGCYLSGGIDSCSMLGLATNLQQAPLKAFTISFDQAEYDETNIACQMARYCNADHDILRLTSEDLYGNNYLKTLWHSERVFYNTLGVAKWHMSRRVRECGYKVVITGEGSDELFAGYPFFKRDMFLHGLHDLPDTEIRNYQQALEQNNKIFTGAILSEKALSHPALESLCGFTPSWIQPWMLTLEMARPLLHDDIKNDLREYDPIEAIANSFNSDQIKGRHPLDKAQYTWIKTMLECQILNWGGDRVDMAHSVESRPAFLDHHIAETAKWIPPRMRIKGNIEKWVLREAVKGILPKVLYNREKFAFMAPPGYTHTKKQHALKALIDTYMNKEQIQKVGLFNKERLEQFIKSCGTEKNPIALKRKDALINHILGLHLLYFHFIKDTRIDN
jgi:asparagine synthase (glutamine-hydrolysing)